jgi:hypothetical protein
MSLYSIAFGLTKLGQGAPLSRAQAAVYRALEAIYDQTDWNFQKGFAGWLAPGVVINTGTVTVTPYSPTVIADATATAAMAAYVAPPFLTTLQFRNLQFTNYDIIAYDGLSTLTLDRPWMEPLTGPGIPFIIYQCYFVAPVQDWRKWITISDFTNAQPLDFWTLTRADLDNLDPQRLNSSTPTNVVPAGLDYRAGSATYGWQRFELYPWQGNRYSYALTYRRQGQLPQTQQDWTTVPVEPPITEAMVEYKAKELLLQDKAAEMEAKVPGSGKGMMLLAEVAKKEYYERFGQVLSIDLNLDGENFTHVHQPGKWQGGQSYATMGGRLNIGSYPSGKGV